MADANKLLKEIITTTTERFNEDGKINEIEYSELKKEVIKKNL